MSINTSVIKAPRAWIVLDGQSVANVTDVSLSSSVSELVGKRGCEKTPWYRGTSSVDWTGSFVFQGISPLLISLATGGTVESSGYAYAYNEEQTIATSVTLDHDPYLTDEDGYFVGNVVKYDANGETMMQQVGSTPTEAGTFYANGTTLAFHADDVGDTIKVSYAYGSGSNAMAKVTSSSEPGYLSLLASFCGVPLSNPSNDASLGFYCPRIKITGMDMSATGGGTDLQAVTFNFTVIPDGNGTVVEWIQ